MLMSWLTGANSTRAIRANSLPVRGPSPRRDSTPGADKRLKGADRLSAFGETLRRPPGHVWPPAARALQTPELGGTLRFIPRIFREPRRRAASGGSWPHTRQPSANRETADQQGLAHDHDGCPRHDSNVRTRLRRPLLYPLSYGGFRTQQGYQPRGPRRPTAVRRLRASSMLAREVARTRYSRARGPGSWTCARGGRR
jgi:hypothetical protein